MVKRGVTQLYPASHRDEFCRGVVMGDLVVSERNLLQRVNIIGSTGKGLRDTHSLDMRGQDITT